MRALKLTEKMREIIEKADLVRGEIDDVPMSTMYGLEKRIIVQSIWGGPGILPIQTTTGGNFPTYSRVKLTQSGLKVAHKCKQEMNNSVR